MFFLPPTIALSFFPSRVLLRLYLVVQVRQPRRTSSTTTCYSAVVVRGWTGPGRQFAGVLRERINVMRIVWIRH